MTNTNDEPQALPVEPLLTVAEVEDLLKLGTTAVYTMMRAGTLPYLRIGNVRRVHPDAIRQLYQNGAPSAPEQQGWKGLRGPKPAKVAALRVTA